DHTVAPASIPRPFRARLPSVCHLSSTESFWTMTCSLLVSTHQSSEVTLGERLGHVPGIDHSSWIESTTPVPTMYCLILVRAESLQSVSDSSCLYQLVYGGIVGVGGEVG